MSVFPVARALACPWWVSVQSPCSIWLQVEALLCRFWWKFSDCLQKLYLRGKSDSPILLGTGVNGPWGIMRSPRAVLMGGERERMVLRWEGRR